MIGKGRHGGERGERGQEACLNIQLHSNSGLRQVELHLF